MQDKADLCPVDAEDADGVLDGDGCPDLLGTVLLKLDAPGGTPVGAVEISARPLFAQHLPDPPTPKQLRYPAGAELRAELDAGLWAVLVRVDGFADYSVNLEVTAAQQLTASLALQPVAGVAQVRLDIRDPKGVPVSGVTVQLGAEAQPVPAPRGLLETTMGAGEQLLIVRAPGYQEGRERVSLVAGELRELQLTLRPMPLVDPRGDTLALRTPLTFSPGTDVLGSESYASLDALASWLKEHPDVGLLRVEVHSNGRGGDPVQLRLTQRQAEAITRALVDRGVPEASLYAVGFGSSSPVVSPLLPDAEARNNRVELVLERGGGR
ncbi:MAG: OmpA family protein [Alphaproteobacteria bacterium]|nr:OmpA family protein [Alphaproteobacteria bacterium]MCB9792098.1 OmpA family protein [Alphaproteobacteria bacterium]